MMLWLYIHFPQLQLDTLQRDNDTTSPLVIIDKTSNRVVQHNDTASRHGITPGLDLATAGALCHRLDVVEYKDALETERLVQLATRLYQFNADLVLSPPDGILCKASSMLKLYGSISRYLQTIKAELGECQVLFHYALSPLPESAKVLATCKADIELDSKESTLLALQQLEINRLGFADKQVGQLNRLGIRQAKQLMALSPTEVGQRFGHALLARLSALQTTRLPQPCFFKPPEFYRQSLELLHDIENSQTLCFPLRRMLQDMEAFLALRQALVPSVTIRFNQRDHESRELSITAAAAEYKASRWMPLVQIHLEKLHLDAAVTHIGLHAETLVDRQEPSRDLFEAKRGQLTPQELVSLLQAKSGEGAVYSLAIENDHRPEKAFRRHAALSVKPGNEVVQIPLRPTLLHLTPQLLFGKPELLSGPERISSGWWDSHAVQRDYFVARNHLNQLCWVYRTAEGRWYEHGLFS